MVLPESTMTTAYEVVCEALLWNMEVAPRARCAALECLDLLWEALVEQEGMHEGKSNRIPIARFFPRDLSLRISWPAIRESLLAEGDEHAKSKEAAAGLVVTLAMGAGIQEVMALEQDLPDMLFRAIDGGCKLAYSALQTLSSDCTPEK